MRTFTRLFIVAAVLLVPASSLRAQSAVDPSGHWEGAIQTQPDIKVEIDLVKKGTGEFAGTFFQPEQRVKGLPFSPVVVARGAVRVVVKSGADAATFVAKLSGDGKSMSGDVAQGGASIPFSLTRTGES